MKDQPELVIAFSQTKCETEQCEDLAAEIAALEDEHLTLNNQLEDLKAACDDEEPVDPEPPIVPEPPVAV